MELVISALAGKLNTWYLLSDKDDSPLKYHLYTHVHLNTIRQSEWFTPVLEKDKTGILNGITNNQLMVVLYFYLNDNSRSATIMNQWLLDAGCNEAQAESLTQTIYLARLDKDGLPDDSLNHPVQLNKLTQLTEVNTLTTKINTLPQSTLPEMLTNMEDAADLRWSFDMLTPESSNNNNNNNNNNSNSSSHKVLNLSTVQETSILIEDHHCIITGYTVDITSFIELVSGEDETLARQLSALVPLHLRDHYSTGRLFIEHPQVEALLLKNRFSTIENYGLESSGHLKQFNGLETAMSHKSTLSHETQLAHLSHKSHLSHLSHIMPFYLKLIKN